MSIASEITRLQGAKSDLKDAIEGKGVTVPSATKLDGYADLVDAISQGGGTLGTKTITSNGTYNASSDGYDGYSTVTANVPNSYSASDEGKVVSNGALVGQTTGFITENGTYTTTTNNEVIANVPNTYSASDEGKVVSNGALVAQTAHADVTPTTSDQTIDTTTNNSIKVKGDADLVAGNIKKDVDIFGVTGTYEGGGGGVSWDDIASNEVPVGEIVLSITALPSSALFGMTSKYNWEVYAPDATSIGKSVFRECTKLTSIRTPNVTSHSDTTGYKYYHTAQLALCDIGKVSIRTADFQNCSVLKTLIMRDTTVQSLNNVNAFNDTTMKAGGSGCTIYIPKVLYDHLGDGTSLDYKAASNWSTIDARGVITWAQLEGSIYESPTWGH